MVAVMEWEIQCAVEANFRDRKGLAVEVIRKLKAEGEIRIRGREQAELF